RLGAEPSDAAQALPAIDTDGSWQLAPLSGRAGKDRAQYVGATARAAERGRRLAEVDRQLADQRRLHTAAETDLADARAGLDAIERWLAATPLARPLLTAEATLDERAATERAEQETHAEAQRNARAARERVVRRQGDLDELGARHRVPTDSAGLAALEERVRGLLTDVRDVRNAVGGLRRDLGRWREDHAAVTEEAAGVRQLRDDAGAQAEQADTTEAALAALRESVGSSVRELEERLRELRGSVEQQQQESKARSKELTHLAEQVGSAKTALQHAADEADGHRAVRAQVLTSLAAMAEVPGLVDSACATAGVEQPPEPAALAAAGSASAADDLPAAVRATAELLAGLAPGEPGGSGGAGDAPVPVDANLVWRAYNEAVNGPAADHEPSVAGFGDLLAVTGRDDAGEAPVAQLAERVVAGVARDQELLTRRERERFEEHVLGELGDALRRCRLEADELVAAMNQLLAGVSTSQGIRVRLDWKLRDDVPADAREAIRLLGQPVGALLPEERTTLRDALHRLIEADGAEHPELSYAEHLAAALDYRGWFGFRIRYTRPENEGSWLELHRRSPLSQGEQKVLCYLPLFAAAAAHFTSLAGAAPHAPRLVLLDDAFPKIDVRTHPLLFGLLVQLDLDFVVTSERLWGDHDTVPSLAIYEALRDPGQRGIAQYEYRWDGRQLRSVG
ncbi:MAG: SbcC/MukB-like Walker B domain-containing protein, partial [Nocardioidaceae bacterium]